MRLKIREATGWHYFSSQKTFLTIEFTLNTVGFLTMKHTKLMQLSVSFIRSRVVAFTRLVFTTAEIKRGRFHAVDLRAWSFDAGSAEEGSILTGSDDIVRRGMKELML